VSLVLFTGQLIENRSKTW